MAGAKRRQEGIRGVKVNPEIYIVEGFLHQCALIFPSVKRCIEEAADYGKDTVVEGMHLHPLLYSKIAKELRFIFVWLSYSEASFKQRVHKRCNQTYRNRSPARYLDERRAQKL